MCLCLAKLEVVLFAFSGLVLIQGNATIIARLELLVERMKKVSFVLLIRQQSLLLKHNSYLMGSRQKEIEDARSIRS